MVAVWRIPITVLSNLWVFGVYTLTSLLIGVFRIILWTNDELYYSVACRIYNVMWGVIWLPIVRGLSRVNFHFVGDSVNPDERAIVISNHKAAPDPCSINVLALQSGVGTGRTKFVIKKSLQWVPGFGWARVLLKDPLLSRKWAEDEATIKDFAANFVMRGFRWMVIFPEGTRLGFGKKMDKKLVEGHKFSRERNQPVFNHLLFPRTKGFVAIGEKLRSEVDCIYDLTLAYNKEANYAEWTGGFLYDQEVYVHVKRIPISDLPADDKLSSWVIDRWIEKDKLLAYFDKNGRFPMASSVSAARSKKE